MKKNMYSLMLSEEVVRAVDALAAKQGTNRSNLVNQILAEHLSLVTPEKHVRNVFDIIEQLMGRQDFLLFSQPNDLTMSIKSSLRYHYRPTIRYEVEMYRAPGRTFGQLKISYRTTSAELLVDLTRFFKIWMRLEEIYVTQFFDDGAISYSLENGRFCRTFALPHDRQYSEEQLANAISGYIALFDEMLKDYLDGKYASLTDMENRYVAYLNGGAQII